MSGLGGRFRTQATILRLLAECLAQAGRFPWRGQEILASIVQMGVGSLPIVVISTTFAGMVTTNMMAYHMARVLQSVDMMPGFTAQIILRELGTAIPALLLVSKAGASMTAEVGTMKITEQIDALRLLRIDPVRYLVFPRFIASIVSCACLTMVAIVVTLFFAVVIAVTKYRFGALEYVNAMRHYIEPKDLVFAAVKSAAFGAVIPIISCAYGFECKGGAEGVGSAATDSVVASTIAIIVLDFALTFAFSQLF
jgi:phospholipid/cholesterol/gamma-HCH transport system permease protein